MKQKGSNAREITQGEGRCPCGSGQYFYRLFDHKKEFVLLCCHACEKTNRYGLTLDTNV